jgi:hypothetical protein
VTGLVSTDAISRYARSAVSASLLTTDQREQAFVLLAAGWAAVEVCAQTGQDGVGVLVCEFELDVAVELVEADVAADFGFRGPEEPSERLL